MLVSLLYLRVLLLLLSYVLAPAVGERIVRLHSLEKLKEDELVVQSSVQLSERDADGNILISGEMKQLVILDDEYKVKVVINAKKKDDDEASVREMPEMGICKLMSTYYKTYIYDHLRDYANAPSPDDCPLAAQEYHLKDYPLHSASIKKLLQPGFYSVLVGMSKDSEIKVQYRIEFDVEEN